MMSRTALLLALIVALPARADPVAVHYAAYAAGLNAVNMDAEFEVTARGYRVRLNYKTAGATALVFRASQDTVVAGHFAGDHPVPERLFSTGYLRGKPRVTQIDYVAGVPHIRQLQPPIDEERQPVPPGAQVNTIDTLSAMAELVRQVNASGSCEGHVTIFDGRRLSELEAHTKGRETLPPTGRSSFTGPALRCDFVGRQTGGFLLDADMDTAPRQQHGSAWFAAIAAGGMLIPVRMTFTTRWFGDATMYLAVRE